MRRFVAGANTCQHEECSSHSRSINHTARCGKTEHAGADKPTNGSVLLLKTKSKVCRLGCGTPNHTIRSFFASIQS